VSPALDGGGGAMSLDPIIRAKSGYFCAIFSVERDPGANSGRIEQKN
jgi:hypothetical protein